MRKGIQAWHFSIVLLVWGAKKKAHVSPFDHELQGLMGAFYQADGFLSEP